MSVLMLTSDLMFSSRAAATAQAAGVSFATASSVDALLGQAAESETLRLVILDLTTPGFDVARAVAALRELEPAPTVVAYASHVLGPVLQRAREAGCDQVLTRGQFDRNLDELLRSATT